LCRRWPPSTSDGAVFLLEVCLLVGVPLLTRVPLLAEVPRPLVGARLGAFPGFVPELPVVPANVVGCRRVVGGAATTASGLRVAVCPLYPQ